MTDYPLETKFKAQENINLALQSIVACVFSELAKDPKFETAIRIGFDNAALSAEVLAMKLGGSKKGETGSEVLRIIEGFREITFAEKR